ncbi:hypothetical protein SAMN05444411_105131 [Lutibacter oricola]|uniref:VOC domain-containing protein n=1 Tax=Lutibacter oricola TaxID=762486 RepID=A0A1H3BJ59_9FLAO|nr:hypothetical protein [Lutibacter oricola]SDX41748.1 hypothetical protein SAMN05444411_105131 [Lutibacter oricola]
MDYKFSHIGIPTTEDKNWDGYCEPGKFKYTDFAKDEYNVEYVKFDKDSEAHEMVKTMPHVSYFVDSIEEAIEGKELLGAIFSPAEGVRVAYVEHKGSPVEFLEIKS